jgi:hypothetical protein
MNAIKSPSMDVLPVSDDGDDASMGGPAMSKDEAVAKLTELFDAATVAALQDPVWKVGITLCGR